MRPKYNKHSLRQPWPSRQPHHCCKLMPGSILSVQLLFCLISNYQVHLQQKMTILRLFNQGRCHARHQSRLPRGGNQLSAFLFKNSFEVRGQFNASFALELLSLLLWVFVWLSCESPGHTVQNKLRQSHGEALTRRLPSHSNKWHNCLSSGTLHLLGKWCTMLSWRSCVFDTA